MKRKRIGSDMDWSMRQPNWRGLVQMLHTWRPAYTSVLSILLIVSSLLWASSVAYQGRQASASAVLLTIHGSDTYRLFSSIFSSGSDDVRGRSSQYQLISSFGEPALPHNQTELASQHYHHQPGFLAAAFARRSPNIYLPLISR